MFLVINFFIVFYRFSGFAIQVFVSCFEEFILVFQAPAQFPKIKMSQILLSIELNFGLSYLVLSGLRNHFTNWDPHSIQLFGLERVRTCLPILRHVLRRFSPEVSLS